jgi:predicted metal-dependent hydrolase
VPPKKRNINNIISLTEPNLNTLQILNFQKGISLFNKNQFWHAHESWEDVWKTLDCDEEIFFRGLIQLAAGLQCILLNKLDGALSNLNKSIEKLSLFSNSFLGLDVKKIIENIEFQKLDLNFVLHFKI